MGYWAFSQYQILEHNVKVVYNVFLSTPVTLYVLFSTVTVFLSAVSRFSGPACDSPVCGTAVSGRDGATGDEGYRVGS